MNLSHNYKKNYHPLIILFYVYGMLDHKQIEIIPKNTRSNWNKFKHTNYDYDDWVKPFLIQFEDIKTIYMREHLRKSMILLMHISKVGIDKMDKQTPYQSNSAVAQKQYVGLDGPTTVAPAVPVRIGETQ